jgi:uncharacterized membrane protein (UPF0127 family)
LLLPLPGGIAAETATLVLHTDTGPHSFNIEIAKTPSEKILGLMYRRSLPADAGMLFLYDRPQPVTFWMRNTYIPLDMVFIGADGRVQRIESHTEPFSLAAISSDGDVESVLELNAGTADYVCAEPRQALAAGHSAVW